MKDEVFFRKLVADGEGVGEERRFQHVISFLREIQFAAEDKTAEAIKALKQLEAMEISISKQNQVADMNRVETNRFVELANNVDYEVGEAHRKMEEAKKRLSEARLVRKNRQEYSTVVKTIDEIPSRPDTERRLLEIRDELEQQHERQRCLEAKLNERKNHLQAFNIILSNFQQFITDDDEVGDDNVEPDDDREVPDDNEKMKIEKLETI
ncbi:unnamed protein product [Caenorhabditis auriculariae]|uniref:THO complex subunit 7 n=1 Tax=Caenorhabditis auriculariae TaxID=2777116 RepID=A0A8S1H763_9PELO|nr:unnamed protein product [Caenorhabditis auriculariae]